MFWLCTAGRSKVRRGSRKLQPLSLYDIDLSATIFSAENFESFFGGRWVFQGQISVSDKFISQERPPAEVIKQGSRFCDNG